MAIVLNIVNYVTIGNTDFALRVIMGIFAALASGAAFFYYREAWKEKRNNRRRREKMKIEKMEIKL